jgi:Reverse transcriptase (RNA-dependent DNA polymerase)
MYNTFIRASKKLYFETELEKHKSNLKITWELLRKAIGKNKLKKSSIQTINCNGNLIHDAKEIANSFNLYFTTIADTILEDIHPTVRPPEYPFNDNVPLFSIADKPVTNFEILTTFHELNSKRSEDYTGISMYFLKNLTLQLAIPLSHVFNLSFSQGVVPYQLKIAKVVPIFKSGDPLLLDNYRPISLLSNFSKVLEKIMCNRLTHFLTTNKILSKSQFGFRRKHSTIHPIIHLLNEITGASNSKKYTLAIFCDLRKAFDTCDHEILVKKLNKLGVRNAELNWFISYLSGRLQFVYLNGIESNRMQIKKGVPQGSILGPLLFLVYVNDLPECSALITFLFADDTTLLASSDNLQDLFTFVNLEFKKVVTFFRAHKMALHPKKTNYIVFNANDHVFLDTNLDIFIDSNNEDENFEELKVKIARISIHSSTPAIKFLGVYLDPKLNFKFHLTQIANRISKSLYVIQASKNILSEKSLKNLYYALIHSHLIYGIHVWSAAASSNLTHLEKLQKKAIRIINKAKYNSHTEPMFKDCKILPLKYLILYFKILFMFDFANDLLPESFKNLWVTNLIRRRESQLNYDRTLRDDHLLYVPYVRLEHYYKFPLADFPRVWNEFNFAVSSNSRTSFKSLLKEYFLEKLSIIINCNRLLCPTCHLQAA